MKTTILTTFLILTFVGAGYGQAPPSSATTDSTPTEDESNRALERFLVIQGGLVVPAWAKEIEPEIAYTHNGASAVLTKHDTVTAAVTFRLGLPYTTQIEVRAPYVILDETSRDRASGVGDVRLAVTKEVLSGRDALPSVLLTARWTAPTGDADIGAGHASTGTGFHVVEGLVSAVKRIDPLVFFGTASYALAASGRKFAGVDVRPGDVFGVKLGSILAVSPETSMFAALNLSFAGRTNVAGRDVRDSERTSGTIELGVAHILTSSTLLNVSVQAGVTKDAPDLQVLVSLPYRF